MVTSLSVFIGMPPTKPPPTPPTTPVPKGTLDVRRKKSGLDRRNQVRLLYRNVEAARHFIMWKK